MPSANSRMEIALPSGLMPKAPCRSSLSNVALRVRSLPHRFLNWAANQPVLLNDGSVHFWQASGLALSLLGFLGQPLMVSARSRKPKLRYASARALCAARFEASRGSANSRSAIASCDRPDRTRISPRVSRKLGLLGNLASADWMIVSARDRSGSSPTVRIIAMLLATKGNWEAVSYARATPEIRRA